MAVASRSPLRAPLPRFALFASGRLVGLVCLVCVALLAAIARPAFAEPPPSPTATPEASAVATSGEAPSSAPRAPVTSAAARIHDRRVFEVYVGRNGKSAEHRAGEATKALERLAEEPETPEVRVQDEGEVAVVYAGSTPIVQLDLADATAAGDVSLPVYADGVAAKVRSALRAERRRSAIATTVFGFSLLVFSGLVALLLVRKVGELLERLRAWLDENPGKVPALRVRGIEVVQPAAVRGSLATVVGAATLVARIGILYGWVLIALSIFDVTHGASQRLTGFVLAPITALVNRVVTGLPLIVIAAVTLAAVGIALRFVRLFFSSVARGETTVGWVPRDLAEPTSLLVRAGVVVVTLVVAAPLVTGADDGVLSRAGVVALVAIGIAATPVFASAAAGIAVVFGRRLRVGTRATVGGRDGKVVALTMFEAKLEDEDGAALHVPHLTSLWLPTRVLGSASLIGAEVSVAPETDLAVAIELLRKAASSVGTRVRVDVTGLDASGAHLRVAVSPARGADRNALWIAIATALRTEGIALGHAVGKARG